MLVAAAMILIIHMLKCVFLILLKPWISKYLIWCQELMKQVIYLGIKPVYVNVY